MNADAPANSKWWRILLAACAALYILQVASRITTMTPWEDEGYFGDPALTLLRLGYLGTRSVDPAGAWISPTQWLHVDRYFYYMPPLYELLLSAWWKLFGFGIFTMRALSGLAGVLLFFATVGLARRLSPLAFAPYATAIYLVTNYHFITAAATGRQDCLVTALGVAGLWIYLILQEHGRPRLALLCGHGLVAAACLTHPNGVLYFVPILYLMWRQGEFQLKNLLLSAVPYFVFLAAWALYIANDPNAFLKQFGGNASPLRPSFLKPLAALTAELGRYYFVPSSETYGRAKVILTIPMLLAAAAFLLIPQLRRTHRSLSFLIAYFVLALTFVVGRKWDGYLINIVPAYAITVGALTAYLAQNRPPKRWIALSAFSFVCLLGLAATARIVSMMRYQHEYAPVVAFVKSLPPSQTRIMAACEFGFGLGFDKIRDDTTLGFHSGTQADTIITGEWYNAQDQSAAVALPGMHRHIQDTLAQHHVAFAAGQYKVYVK